MGVSILNANAVLKPRLARDLSRILMLDPMLDPFMVMMKRKKGAPRDATIGQKFIVPIKLRDQQAANYLFSKSQGKTAGSGAGSASKYVAWEVPVVPGYNTGRVDGQSEAVSSGNDNAFVDLLDEETQGALRGAQREIANFVFKSGTGARARITAVTASPDTVSVAPADTAFFEIGMDLVASAADGTGALRSATALTITGINPVTGLMSLSGSPVALSWSAGSGGDFTYQDGDFAADTQTKIIGLDKWNPIVVPTVGSEPTFLGVPRYNDWKLYGLRHNAADSTDTHSAIIDATAKIHTFARGKTTHGFANPLDFGKLVNSVEASRRTTVKDSTYDLGFEAITVHGMSGTFPLLSSPSCPKGQIRLVNSENLYFIHAGEDLAYIIQEDGNIVLRASDADAFEVRVRSQVNLVCDDPSQLCVIYGVV